MQLLKPFMTRSWFHNPVRIDGRKAVPVLTRTDFVAVSPTGVSTRRAAQPEPLETAVLGVTLVFGVDRPPSEIALRWQVFPTSETVVPATWTDPTGSGRMELTAEQPELSWEGDLAGSETPEVRAVPALPPRASLLSFALASLAAVFAIRRRWRKPAVAALAVAIALYPFVRTPVTLLGGWAPPRAAMAEVLDDLLTNVYRSFELRGDSAIYDRLAVSVTGEQLREIFLESRRALELQDRGGARARVDEVDGIEVRSVRGDGEGGFLVEASWTVSGSVNHFGHVHYRRNRYEAALTIRAVDGVWKIRAIEVLDERRVL